MTIRFYKYHGTGNDFILMDNREKLFDIKNQALIAKLCDRRFGIGSDGLILLEKSERHDFYMRYFNADGMEGSMCGNGGRCIVAFAKKMKIIDDNTVFEAVDGSHLASIKEGIVSLQMNDVTRVDSSNTHSFLDTGSPHHVEMVTHINTYPVVEKGRKIRYGAPYSNQGTNVNFVAQSSEKKFIIRTYERGVENETFSCGTGATAVAIAMFEQGKTTSTRIELETLGGKLEVRFKKTKKGYTQVFLKGAAVLVFEGEIEV